ncbi:RHS repeat-associated core domain-containing protein [Streptomyces sp. MK7]|uniref:RHS repeat-associated core domain-containing protein n=1 Tax=Streptomyces sp. MK7 TaxID=3067635 RepID=UPI0037DA2BE0
MPNRMKRARPRGFSVRSFVTALILAVGAAGSLTPVAQAADAKGLGRPRVPDQRTSKVKAYDGPGAAKARQQARNEAAANAAQAAHARAEQRAATWPRSGTADIEPTAVRPGTGTPGGLPVTLTPARGTAPSAAHVTVLDQKAARAAGVTGVLLSVAPDTVGRTTIDVDYSGFAGVLGGGWAQRLTLVQLPQCALTTPQRAECRRRTPLHADNDIRSQSVSAQLPSTAARPKAGSADATAAPTATLLAVTTSGSSAAGPSPAGTGDYSATPLAPASSWTAGTNSGSFDWKYDFTLPPAAAGPTPALTLSYDSGSIDGRTATTNNQASTVGEGFSLTESYIQRSYGSCDDDGHSGVYDQCWKYDNAQLVLNGKSARLVKDANTGAWHLQDDDASTVTHSTGADNGDDNGEYWTVVTGDGTKYVFGLDKLDGATDQRTDSTWTVPVYGDDAGEPGYTKGDAFADRWLTQAWRWNLDYVEDIHGNAATYWYAKESNYYKRDNASTANTSYIRGGYLKEIKYGLRKGALFTDDADAKVTFTHAERCTAADCSSLTDATSDNWPDVPYDAICSDGDADCMALAPAMFTRKRLTGVSTYSWNATTSAYDPVDSWTLTQQFLDGGDIGDTSDQTLTLKSLTRTGKAGATALPVAPITFTYQMRPNRVDATDDILPLTRPRLSTFTSETGAITTVTLNSPECVRSEVLDAPQDTNTRSCYPQYWNINGSLDAKLDWFHKYRVLAVTVSDPAGNNDAVEYAYSYSGAGWHYDDDPFRPKAERTWSDWRGYREVTTYTGALNTTRSKSVSLYFQGMDGDKQKDGTTRSVSLAPLPAPGLGAASVTDRDEYAGQTRETVAYNGSAPIGATVTDPWSKETARQSVPDAADHVARFVRTAKSTTYTYLTASQSWRSRAVSTTYDAYGMPVTSDDSGEVGKAGDETCTRTWYARNTGAGLTDLVSRSRTVGRACSVSDASLSLPADSRTRGDVLSDTAVVYDSATATAWTAAQTPTEAEPRWAGRATGYPASADSAGERTPTGWQTTATMTYDTLGRPLDVTDADNRTTSTAYTPASSGPLTKTVGTDAKGYKTTTFLDPRRSLPLRSYDANLKKTEFTYDALGRKSAVWLPNRSSGAGQSANYTFTYRTSTTEPSAVGTSALKADGQTYNTSYALYDALLRPLQTQTPTPQGGRLLSDTRYDTRGMAYETLENIFDSTTAPDATYTRAEYGEAPKQTETVYDGAGRAVQSSLYVYGVKKWSTTTGYTGDSTASTALAGGSAIRTVVDVRGQTVQTRQYSGASPADADFGTGPGAAHSDTAFTYTLDAKPKGITGPDGAAWSYTYDLFGRQVRADDPDKGTTTTGYDILDRAITTSDARPGSAVLTEYDELGRPTATWSGSKTDANLLTSYTYDTVLKGMLSASTRYVGGRTGKAYTKRTTAVDSLGRPTGTQLELPADDPLVTTGKAPSTISFSSHYNIDGTLGNTTQPALGGLPSEIVDYDYNAQGQTTAITGSTGYLLHADYSALGQPLQLTLGTTDSESAKKAYVTNTYEEGTGRQATSHVTDQTHPYMLQALDYTYDDAGDVTAVADPTPLAGAETECFGYDGLRRLTESWTPSSQDCSDPRSATALGGPAPYWTGYTYNNAGQRTTETRHQASGTTTTTYCYDTAADAHALLGTSTKADCATPDRTYHYDEAGNATSRAGDSGQQSLTWTPEGKLDTLTEGGKQTGYVYDADGNLLIRATQDGERVLYAGATELHLRANGTTYAQRYYGSGQVTVACRTNVSGTDKLYYLVSDQHGTSTLAIASDTQDAVKRYLTAFGAARTGGVGTWIDDKGYLGKTADSGTGLTHLGAREYDPDTGQFISVDPVLEASDTQSLNGYSYSANNPVTNSDPTGRTRCDVDPSFCPGHKPAPVPVACPSLTNPQCPEYGGGGGTPVACPSLTNPQCPEYGRTTGAVCPSLNNPQCPEYGGSAPCPSLSNPRCPEYHSAPALKTGPAPNPNDNALKEVLANWTSSTGCMDRGFGGRTCAAVNGILAGGGTLVSGMDELATRWKAILAVFANPAATASELDEAITDLALYLKHPGALKLASKVLGSQVQLGGARFGSAIPGMARYLKLAPYIGGAATFWSNYQGTGGNLAETTVMTGMDLGLIWAGAATGAYVGGVVGTWIPVPGVGTGVGVVVGAVSGIVYTSIANNVLGKAWDKLFG